MCNSGSCAPAIKHAAQGERSELCEKAEMGPADRLLRKANCVISVLVLLTDLVSTDSETSVSFTGKCLEERYKK